MTTRFDRDTDVLELEASAGITAYEGTIDHGWWVFRSRFAEQGFVEAAGEVWSRDGLLLAQSRQLAVIG